MALKSLTFMCPSCEGSFRALLDLAREPPPRFCLLCGFDVGQDQALSQGLSAPHLPKSIRKTVDDLHKAMEEGAQFRADYASGVMGMDTEGANMLKLGDMKDGLRQGDTSDAPVNNAITKIMEMPEAAPHVGFQGGAAAGLGYSGAVPNGPFPNAGARAQSMLRDHHARYARESGMIGAASSSLPALETENPNYRKRVG
jgi:hypothetical protein